MTSMLRTVGNAFLRHNGPSSHTLVNNKKVGMSRYLHSGWPGVKLSAVPSSSCFERISRIKGLRHFHSKQSKCNSTEKRSEPKCVITLYRERTLYGRKFQDQSKESFSDETADKLNDFIMPFFEVGIDQKWEKILLESMFLNNSVLDWFEFTRLEKPNTVFGIKIEGDISAVFNNSSDEFYEPIEKQSIVSVSVEGSLGNYNVQLDYEKIKKEWRKDHSLVALFNSVFFNSMTECSTNLKFIRRIEKFGVIRLDKDSERISDLCKKFGNGLAIL